MMLSSAIKDKQFYRWLVLCNVAIGTFMSTMDSSSVNVALPTIAANFKIPLTTVQWVVTAYLLSISCLLLSFGRLGDLLGKSRIFTVGFLIFSLGSTLCFFSTSITQLICFRIIEGIGAAMLMSNSMGIITGIFPADERGRALGSLGTVVAVGSMAGPSLGGILVGNFGWTYIFLLNVFIGFSAFILSLYILPEDQGVSREQKFDFPGAGLFAGAMALLLLGLNSGRAAGWQTASTMVILAGAVLLFSLFFYTEKKVAYPLLDLSLFENKQFSAGNLAGMLSFVSMFFTTVILTFFMQNVLGYSPQKVGLLMMAFPAVMAFTSPLSGFLSDRFGPVILTTSGMALNIVALFGLSRINLETQEWVIALFLALNGIGMALFQSPNNSCIMGTVPQPKLGISGGVLATVRNVGMVLGIAVSVSIFDGRYQQIIKLYEQPGIRETNRAFIESQSLVFLIASLICIVALIASTVRGGNQSDQKRMIKMSN